ncbi:stage III sporulation protein AG [Cytobacillus sp. IB215665]|uniref:stage III sporulation protein AG n=1 Tax=Cytobacillus sp. IB215665 TaxID=3097357 RepID=UPI002A14872A|nr:stage III sporulation protein AG [Cytobacillus sp. IB215665]MDX8364282.1 stage III sporulation protein AG [Cytobacillus sp. IB215665]
MEKNRGFIQWIQNFLSKNNGSNDKTKSKYIYVLILLVLGVVLILLNNVMFPSEEASYTNPSLLTEEQKDTPAFGAKNTKDESMSDYETNYENQLKDLLEQVEGVGDVAVSVNLDSTEINVLEKSTTTSTQTTKETDREGGKREVEDWSVDEQAIIIRDGDKETPIVLTTKKPKVRGVLVVAKLKDMQAKQRVKDAVIKLLDVPSHRVEVLPKKSEGE